MEVPDIIVGIELTGGFVVIGSAVLIVAEIGPVKDLDGVDAIIVAGRVDDTGARACVTGVRIRARISIIARSAIGKRRPSGC